MTQTEHIISRIVETGGEEVPSRSRKYRQFFHPHLSRMSDGSVKYLFVGKCAALRAGPCASKSASIPPVATLQMLDRRSKLHAMSRAS